METNNNKQNSGSQVSSVGKWAEALGFQSIQDLKDCKHDKNILVFAVATLGIFLLFYILHGSTQTSEIHLVQA